MEVGRYEYTPNSSNAMGNIARAGQRPKSNEMFLLYRSCPVKGTFFGACTPTEVMTPNGRARSYAAVNALLFPTT